MVQPSVFDHWMSSKTYRITRLHHYIGTFEFATTLRTYEGTPTFTMSRWGAQMSGIREARRSVGKTTRT